MTESDDRMTSVETRLDKMGDDLHALRVLYEHHDTQIQRIAEVQVEHGTLLREIKGEVGGMKGDLSEIKGELAPLRDLHDFVRRVAENHESHTSALEKHASPPSRTGAS